MATIAKLAVMLSANTGQFTSKIASAAKPLATFAGGIAGTSAKVLGLMSAITGLVGAGSISVLTTQSMEAIDANAKLADRLGFTTENLVGLQHAAGLAGTDAASLTGALEKMLNSLADAATKGGPAADALAQMGLDAKALAAGTPDAAFKAIADGLKGVQNPAQRASMAIDIFGKSGQGLLPLMLSGAEGIAAAQAEAEKLGLTYSRVDAAKVEAANDSISRMKAVVTGVGNQLAIGLAPYIDAAAVKLTELGTQGGGIGPKIGGAIEWVATALASTADYLNLAKAGFKLLQAGGTAAVLGLVWTIDKLAQGIAYVSDLLGMEIDTTFLDQLTEGLAQDVERLTTEAGQAFDSFQRGDNAKAVSRVFTEIRTSSQKAAEAVAASAAKTTGAFKQIADDGKNLKKVTDTLADLEKKTKQFGLSDAQAKLMDLQGLGATPEQINRAKELLSLQDQFSKLDKIDTGNAMTDFAARMEKLQQLYAAGKVTAEQFAAIRDTARQTLSDKLTEQAKSITDSVKTPLEAYTEEVDKLNTLLDRGLITQDTFDRAAAKARGTLDTASDTAAPQIITAGSAEAQRFAFDQARGMQKLTRDDLPKKQLAEAETQTTLLQQVAQNTRSTAAPQEVGI